MHRREEVKGGGTFQCERTTYHTTLSSSPIWLSRTVMLFRLEDKFSRYRRQTISCPIVTDAESGVIISSIVKVIIISGNERSVLPS